MEEKEEEQEEDLRPYLEKVVHMIGVPKECEEKEKRVALTPKIVR